ncbi:MAG: DNA repair protein RecO [Alphaproteobacteria bacterium]
MHWQDEAIILSVRKHGEHQARVALFTRQHGIYASIARGAYSKKNRGIWQPGNIVTVNWNARLAEHMGTVSAEMQEPITAFILDDAAKLAALSSAATLMEMILPERHPYPVLYPKFKYLLMILKEGRPAGRPSPEPASCDLQQKITEANNNWQEDYVRFELALLSESGFGLDLSACAATGQKDDLTYVSPKSGRAVCTDAGEPYKDKLLPLPQFLLDTPSLTLSPLGGRNSKETLAGLRLSGYFLEHWLAGPHGKQLPASRQRLLEMIEKTHG